VTTHGEVTEQQQVSNYEKDDVLPVFAAVIVEDIINNHNIHPEKAPKASSLHRQ